MREEIYTFGAEEGLPFYVEMCGVSYCDGSYHISRTSSKIYVMEYVLSGHGRVEEGGRSAVASAGDVYFLRRGRRHSYRSDAKDPWVKLWFNFKGDAVDKLCECYGIGSETVFHAPELGSLFEEAVDIGRRSTDARAVSEAIAVIFLKILQSLSHRTDTHDDAPTIAERLRTSLDSLSDFSEKLDTITGRLGCTKNHTIREFHASYGVSPYEYLQRRRFALAKALIRNTAMSVTEIAERLGFWDVHYFSGSFKRRFGKTPREYRGAQAR